MPTPKPLSKTAVKRHVKRIIAENPDTRNPVNDASRCLYHQEQADGTVARCIVGQLGHELGLPEPEAFGPVIGIIARESNIWDGLFDEKAIDYLNQVQMSADCGRPAWGAIPKRIVNG